MFVEKKLMHTILFERKYLTITITTAFSGKCWNDWLFVTREILECVSVRHKKPALSIKKSVLGDDCQPEAYKAARGNIKPYACIRHSMTIY